MTTLRTFTTSCSVINVMAKALFQASRSLLRDFGEVGHLQNARKSPKDFVSITQKRIVKVLRDSLGQARPQFSFYIQGSEEVSQDPQAEGLWLINPLCGLVNFQHGVPHFALTLALKSKGQTLNACVYDPVHDEIFWAEKGRGAFVNDKKLYTSSRQHLRETLIGTGLSQPYIPQSSGAYCQHFQKFAPHVEGLRNSLAPALDLAYVAAGRLDGSWHMGITPPDQAAGLLLVHEAGGTSNNKHQTEFNKDAELCIASNSHLYPSLSKILTPSA